METPKIIMSSSQLLRVITYWSQIGEKTCKKVFQII